MDLALLLLVQLANLRLTNSYTLWGCRLENRNVLEVRDPFTGDVIGTVLTACNQTIAEVLAQASAAAVKARASSRYERGQILTDIADQIEAQLETFSVSITKEVGKPIRNSRYEVSRCIRTLRLSAEAAKQAMGGMVALDAFVEGDGRVGATFFQPFGTVFAITPWNDPLNLAAHKIGPAIAAGNAVILKPSPRAPLTAAMLVECISQVSPLKNLVQIVHGGAQETKLLLDSDEIDFVSFTGGEAVGRQVRQASGLKPCALELGGNGSVIVCEDADIDQAVEASVAGAFSNSGQNCIGVQRIYVHSAAYPSFIKAFKKQASALRVGNPMDEQTDLGPVIDSAELARITSTVDEAIAMGAELLVGHNAKSGCYEPTALSGTSSEMGVNGDEIFGPVAVIEPFGAVSEAIELANKSRMSIHAAIFTQSLRTARRAVENLDAASVILNDSTDFRVDNMPFGGWGRGNHGREGVRYAMEGMSQRKLVCIR